MNRKIYVQNPLAHNKSQYLLANFRMKFIMYQFKLVCSQNGIVILKNKAFSVRHYIPIPEIDHWLRRRLRMCYFKQWRRAKTKVRELRKLGTSLHAAISVAISRKGPWRLSRTLATQTGMTNKWLKDQGLLSVKELWVNIHYPATAR